MQVCINIKGYTGRVIDFERRVTCGWGGLETHKSPCYSHPAQCQWPAAGRVNNLAPGLILPRPLCSCPSEFHTEWLTSPWTHAVIMEV